MKIRGQKLVLVPILALLWAARAISGEPAFWLSQERNPIEATRERIRGASQTIDAVVYKMNEASVHKALERALGRGVAVRILADAEMPTTRGSLLRHLERRGAEVRRWKQGKLHAKFTIFDGRLALAGSFNWTDSARRNNVELGISVTDEAAIARLQSLFDELWDAAPSLKKSKSD